ncbi:RHS repeat-associated core domain-containing protein [Pseudomonas petrae]|uniref:DUF6531 domain-containing protein n=1 Tax=Pseudomonas petrae TaxID=2912190 RepID=A0ABS9I683_9PSED|nr:RHS repeat-associated core domain-containing protein [Pseudomonas petrae]MCF7543293.1 DUF6531 domain-containing protein [Pseudomonas petrae]
MSDALWAARVGDALSHTSMMADILGGVLEVAANIAIGVLATAAVVAATGITVATGGIGACVLGAVVGLVVGVVMSKTGADKGLSSLCEDIGNGLFPPTPQALISTGSTDTFINGIPAARAAGSVLSTLVPSGSVPSEDVNAPEEQAQEEPTFLDMAQGFFSQLWRPTVATPGPGVVPKPLDLVVCTRHPPMPPQFLAEGSEKVTINGQPAVRSGDRSTCEATVVSSGLISPNVRIGGGKVVVREIRSGKTPGIGLAITALMMLKGSKGKFISNLPCMLMAGANSFVTSAAISAASNAIVAATNPVHAATGAKVLGDIDDLDFILPGVLPITWQRVYNSRDERRNGIFGAGWSVAFEASVETVLHVDGGHTLIYTDEQGRRIDIGWVAPGSAVYSSGEGLNVRRHGNGQLLIESDDGLYRLFEPGDGSLLRLSTLGDRNDNRIHIDYDDQGRIARLRDGFGQCTAELTYATQWPGRLHCIERIYPDQTRELLTSYEQDIQGDLAVVRDVKGHQQRRFVYDNARRMIEHQLPIGLRCFYDWKVFEDGHSRVIRHWTDDGDAYTFDYDLDNASLRIHDSLNRTSMRRWNIDLQITEHTDNLGQIWRFDWDDERHLTRAVDPAGGQWQYSYDDFGNLCQSTDPMGRSESIVWLSHWALPLTETNSAGHSWRYRYDTRGNRTHETDPLGHTTRYRYDARGKPVEIIDASGKHNYLRWNTLGQLIEHVDCSGYPTRLEYNVRGMLCAKIDATGERIEYEYDELGRMSLTRTPDGRTQHYQRNPGGQLTAVIDPAEHSTVYHYDRRGQVSRRIDAHGRTVHFRYDSFGRLLQLTNENGEHYRFAWDSGDRLTVQQNLDGSARHYAYDALNNVVQTEDIPAPQGNGMAVVPTAALSPIVHRFERDAVGRMLAKTTDDGRHEYQYDPLDQLLGVSFTDRKGQTQALKFAYDPLGQLLEQSSAAGNLRHHYDELGNLAQTELPDGRWLNNLYYGSGHLHQINLDGLVISDFERDRLHREVSRTQGQMLTVSDYDRGARLRSRLTRRANQPSQLPAPAQQHFDYDPSNNLVGRLDRQTNVTQNQRVHYDATGRIVASQESVHGQHETFAYDAAANLLDGPRVTGLIVHNRLLTYQDKRYRYDAWGRLIEKRVGKFQVQRFGYDAEHRLITVCTQRGNQETIVQMAYDPLGRRKAKIERDPRGYVLSETLFVWDRLRLLQEHRHSQTSLYLYADDSHEPLARIDGSGTLQKVRYYHNNVNGLPEQLSEADGHSVWQARYQVWGNTLEEVREPYFIEEQNLRFQGQYLDRETGLHYNTFRFYDPDIGRFTTPDPIGLAGGLNLYAYAPNPLAWVDPLGWSCSSGGKTAISRNSARKLLKSRGRDKKSQQETVDSFEGQIYATRGKKGDVFTITEDTPGAASQVFVTRGSAGATAADRRANLALPPNNSATYEGNIALTKNQVLLEGKVAPQPQWGADKTGGGWQVVTSGGRYTGATTRL